MHLRAVAAALAVLPLATGCGADFAAPRTAAECFEAAPDSQGHHFADGVSGWNVAYSQDSRSVGSSLTVYVCAPTDFAGTVSVDAPDGVEVEPDPVEVSGDPDDVGELTITVNAEVHQTVQFEFRTDGAGGGTTGATIDSDGDEWSLHPQ